MHSRLVLPALATLAAAQYPTAPVQANDGPATYRATLPETQFTELPGASIRGSITAVASSNGTGVWFTVDVTGLPDESEYGPFGYHVHAMPVPESGNCTEAMAHLDPTSRGEQPACDAARPATCQAGDLSGKHGSMTGAARPAFHAAYAEPFLSTEPGSAFYFGDKSVVIHAANKTRLTCANFARVVGANGTTAPAGPTGTGGEASAIPEYTGAAAAAKGVGSLAVAVLGLAAAFVV